MRAKVPHAQGMWPAFWLRHRNGAGVAEVDIMEYFHSQVPGRTTGTLHLDRTHHISQRSLPFEAPPATPRWPPRADQTQPGAPRAPLHSPLAHTHTNTSTNT